MYKDVVLLFLIGHFLGDYYFQSETSVQSQSNKTVIKHSIIYTLTLLLCLLPVMNGAIFIVGLIISFTHFIIDYRKFQMKQGKNLTASQSAVIYLVDQFLHVSIILLAGLLLKMRNQWVDYNVLFRPFIYAIQEINNMEFSYVLSWILILLIIYKPSSITIRNVLDHFEPHHKQEEDTGVKNAGALIGIFERLIILMMLYANQYTAIGFVLTAKSVARYNRISEDPQFAEYYLLGTLLSSLIIIASYHLIF